MFAHEHRIHHEWKLEVPGQFSYCLDNLPIAERSGFGGTGRDIGDDSTNLLGHQIRKHALDPVDAHSVLNGEERDHGLAIYAELMESFEIRLNARTAAGIGPGDGEGNVHGLRLA